MFENIVGCYVDDLVVKKKQRNDHSEHLQVVFEKLMNIN